MILNLVFLAWLTVATVAFVLPLFVLTFEAFRSYVWTPVVEPRRVELPVPSSRKLAFAAE